VRRDVLTTRRPFSRDEERTMADILEIKKYQYYVFSSRDGSAKTVMFVYGSSGAQIGYVYFQSDEQPLPQASKLQDGNILLYYRYADLPVLVDMLRNESPIYLIYASGMNSRISTLAEAVGEGEA
jgi:hypothetical protein